VDAAAQDEQAQRQVRQQVDALREDELRLAAIAIREGARDR
jgi:hypothetical protein